MNLFSRNPSEFRQDVLLTILLCLAAVGLLLTYAGS